MNTLSPHTSPFSPSPSSPTFPTVRPFPTALLSPLPYFPVLQPNVMATKIALNSENFASHLPRHTTPSQVQMELVQHRRRQAPTADTSCQWHSPTVTFISMFIFVRVCLGEGKGEEGKGRGRGGRGRKGRKGRKGGVPVCAVCSCTSSVLACDAHLFLADGAVALSLAAAFTRRPPPALRE